ncbi:MAG: hypothetical protein O7A06_17965 [Acidobacteria bacterium]|nr:hypothetical protein [Acidobacteriota bacterium]MCZ6751323.1 hypothetical protein [Acidobacteriota bacterium]
MKTKLYRHVHTCLVALLFCGMAQAQNQSQFSLTIELFNKPTNFSPVTITSSTASAIVSAVVRCDTTVRTLTVVLSPDTLTGDTAKIECTGTGVAIYRNDAVTPEIIVTVSEP